MSRSTFLETELGEVLSCKWLGSPIIAKQWLNNDPTVEDGMLAWSESLGLCREVRCSAKDELTRRSSIDVFLLKRWGVKELYFKPTDVSGVRDGGIEEGSDVKLGWITVFCAKIFQSAVGTFVRGDCGRSGEIFPFSAASENAYDTLGKQQLLLALKTWWAAALAALDFAFSFSFLALFFFVDPKLFSLSLWLAEGIFSFLGLSVPLTFFVFIFWAVVSPAVPVSFSVPYLSSVSFFLFPLLYRCSLSGEGLCTSLLQLGCITALINVSMCSVRATLLSVIEMT